MYRLCFWAAVCALATNGKLIKCKPNAIDYGRLLIEECPDLNCLGKDCTFVQDRTGCEMCACPIGSPSRGCDKMPDFIYKELFYEGCPDIIDPTMRRPAKKVQRFFRYMNETEGVDECRSYLYPYCAEIDFNLWTSPNTKEECQQHCY